MFRTDITGVAELLSSTVNRAGGFMWSHSNWTDPSEQAGPLKEAKDPKRGKKVDNVDEDRKNEQTNKNCVILGTVD